jgi:hypothetical protein
MISKRSHRITPALVIACLALAVALSGTGIAAISVLPKNSVGTPQLKANAVISSKVKNGSLLAADFAPGQIPEGAAGPAGAKGPAGPSDSYTNAVAGPVAVPITTAATIARLDLPTGLYEILAKGEFVSTGVNVLDCTLVTGTTILDESGATYWGSGLQTLALSAATELKSDGSVSLRCVSAVASVQGSQLKLTAIKTGALHTTT